MSKKTKKNSRFLVKREGSKRKKKKKEKKKASSSCATELRPTPVIKKKQKKKQKMKTKDERRDSTLPNKPFNGDWITEAASLCERKPKKKTKKTKKKPKKKSQQFQKEKWRDSSRSSGALRRATLPILRPMRILSFFFFFLNDP